MLQTFRERLQGWIIGIIITFLAVALGLFGLQNFWAGGGSSVAVTVDGNKIYESQWNYMFEQVRRRAMTSGLKLNDTLLALMKKEVLQSLIKQQVELKSVTKVGFRISPDQVEKIVMRLPSFQDKGAFSYPKFQQFLSYSGLNEAAFLKEIHDVALVDQLKLAINQGAFILKDEIDRWIQLKYQSRTFDYLIIPQTLLLSKSKPQLEAVENYFKKNQSAFKAPEKIKVDYLLLSPEELKKNLLISEQEIKNYYEENKATYGDKSFESVKSEIKQTLLSEKIPSVLSEKSEQLSELTYTHPDNLDVASKALKIPLKTSDFFTKEGGTGIFADASVAKAAFNPEVLQGRNSDLIQTQQGAFLVLRIKQHEPSSILPFESVKEQIAAKLKNQMSAAEVQKMGQQWLDQLKEGKDLAPSIKPYKLNWKSSNVTTSKFDGVNQEIVRIVLDIPSASIKNDKPIFTGKVLANGDYVLLKLKEANMGSQDTLPAEERETFIKKLQEEYGQLDYDFYMESIMKKAKIKMKG